MKYIIRWNSGYGESFELVDADNFEEANAQAYEMWQDEVQSNADYGVLEFSLDNAEDCGCLEEHPDYKGG